jgi:type III secretion protein U
MSEKTEDPTPKRLRRAREDGDSGASAFAAQSIAFLVAVALVPGAVRALASRAAGDLRAAIAHAGDASPAVNVDAGAIATEVVALTFPLLIAAGLAGGVAFAVQTGGVFASKRIAPRLERLDVVAGFRGLFSGVRLFAVVRALAAAAFVLWIAWAALASHVADLGRLAGPPGARPGEMWMDGRIEHAARAAGALALGVARDAALVGLALAAIDLAVVRRAWMKRLRMSKDEVRREYREAEGDPQLKAARDRAHREVLASATIANVRNATVVIVNPTHFATALQYKEEEGDVAPVVVASGEGELAARIAAAARDYGVPVVRDVPLARALAELEVGAEIPEALYEAVAEILREIWDAEGRESEAT